MDASLFFQDITAIFSYWFFSFYNSSFFLVIKILIGLYVAIIFIDIVLLLILRDVPAHFRTGVSGMDISPVSKNKMKKRWENIKSRISSDNESQYKVAIIEADALVDEILSGIGYKGANMSEKFEQMDAVHIDEHLESLKSAHNIRNRIVHEADFSIDKKSAEDILSVYEDFLKYLEYLS